MSWEKAKIRVPLIVVCISMIIILFAPNVLGIPFLGLQNIPNDTIVSW